MLDCLKSQLLSDDHLTVVFDGHATTPNFSFAGFQCPIHIYVEKQCLGFWGHAIRNKQAPILAQTTYVLHADDDDLYASSAFDKLRKLCTDPETLYIGQMRSPRGRVVPEKHEIVVGHIGTPCGIIPWKFNQEMTFESHQTGDFSFQKTLEKFCIDHDKKIQYLDFIVQHIKPDLGEFNAFAQSDRYADLKNAYGYNTKKLLNHWKKFGIKEKRKARLEI